MTNNFLKNISAEISKFELQSQDQREKEPPVFKLGPLEVLILDTTIIEPVQFQEATLESSILFYGTYHVFFPFKK